MLSEQEQLPEILIKLLRNVPVTSLARDGRKVLGFVFFNNGICISGPERSRQVVGQLLSHINFNLFGLNCFVITEQLRIHRLVLRQESDLELVGELGDCGEGLLDASRGLEVVGQDDMNFTGEAGDVSLEVVDIVLARGILSGRDDSHRLGTRSRVTITLSLYGSRDLASSHNGVGVPNDEIMDLLEKLGLGESVPSFIKGVSEIGRAHV